MKISKLSLILLSGLLVTQATIPMENQASCPLKKAQKAGKIALKIGTGTAIAGVYAFMGTAALASWGLTVGAAALSLARFLKPKVTAPQTPVAPEAPEIKAKNGPNQPAKRPAIAPQNLNKNNKKNRTSLYAKTAFKAAGIMGAVAVENDTLGSESVRENHMTHEQAMQRRQTTAAMLQAQLDECNAHAIQWRKDYNLNRIAEFPRYEGAYQDMITIIDGDVEQMAHDARIQMNQNLDVKWYQSGCKNSQEQMAALARKIQQGSMRLPKL